MIIHLYLKLYLQLDNILYTQKAKTNLKENCSEWKLMEHSYIHLVFYNFFVYLIYYLIF